MRGMRVLGVGCAALMAVGAVAPLAGAETAQEADLAYHGAATLDSGRVEVRITPRNHGPSAVPDATVRLRWSRPLENRQTLPDGCARSGARAVLCRVGALSADTVGADLTLGVRLRDAPTEVLMEIDTVWNGGAVDRNRQNDRQRVLVLDTGDAYYF
ncbi:hypothetical protein [Streptomyces sp. HC307]|uniref:hypothetical protein n=1 Tax=Streptomyces flavusporus TaxID=3385496 RepID=UPI003916EB2F